MLRADQLRPDRAMLLAIDLQEKLLPLIGAHAEVAAGAVQMIHGAALFDLPILVTEQYVKGLGRTHPTVMAALDRCETSSARGLSQGGAESAVRRVQVIEKATFSACGFEPVRERMIEIDRPQVILIGIEAHVCVQQTALDLRVMDYDVFVCADAVGSRGRTNFETALGRLRQAGAIVTTVESALFELCGRCDAPRFKAMLEIIKASRPR